MYKHNPILKGWKYWYNHKCNKILAHFDLKFCYEKFDLLPDKVAVPISFQGSSRYECDDTFYCKCLGRVDWFDRCTCDTWSNIARKKTTTHNHIVHELSFSGSLNKKFQKKNSHLLSYTHTVIPLVFVEGHRVEFLSISNNKTNLKIMTLLQP